MNSPIKIYLTIRLEGSVLVRQDNPELLKTNDGKFVKHYSLVPKQASKELKMTQDAYDHFISDDSRVSGKSKRDWLRLSNKERVKAHCKEICENEGGFAFDFLILQD